MSLDEPRSPELDFALNYVRPVFRSCLLFQETLLAADAEGGVVLSRLGNQALAIYLRVTRWPGSKRGTGPRPTVLKEACASHDALPLVLRLNISEKDGCTYMRWHGKKAFLDKVRSHPQWIPHLLLGRSLGDYLQMAGRLSNLKVGWVEEVGGVVACLPVAEWSSLFTPVRTLHDQREWDMEKARESERFWKEEEHKTMDIEARVKEGGDPDKVYDEVHGIIDRDEDGFPVCKNDARFASLSHPGPMTSMYTPEDPWLLGNNNLKRKRITLEVDGKPVAISRGGGFVDFFLKSDLDPAMSAKVEDFKARLSVIDSLEATVDPLELCRSTCTNDECWILTDASGLSESAGIYSGIRVVHEGGLTYWIDPNQPNGPLAVFPRKGYRETILLALACLPKPEPYCDDFGPFGSRRGKLLKAITKAAAGGAWYREVALCPSVIEAMPENN